MCVLTPKEEITLLKADIKLIDKRIENLKNEISGLKIKRSYLLSRVHGLSSDDPSKYVDDVLSVDWGEPPLTLADGGHTEGCEPNGVECDPVLVGGKCVIGMGSQLVRFSDGVDAVVIRRCLRLRRGVK